MNKHLVIIAILIFVILILSACTQSQSDDDSLEQISDSVEENTANVRVTKTQDSETKNPIEKPIENLQQTPAGYTAEDIDENNLENEISEDDIISEIESGIKSAETRSYSYLVNQGDDKIQILETYLKSGYSRTNIVSEISSGNEPYEMVMTNDKKYAFVSNAGENTIAVLDLNENKVVAKMGATDFPTFIALTSDEKYLFVAVSAYIKKYDVSNPESPKLIDEYRWDEIPSQIVLNPVKEKLYAVNAGSESVVMFDLVLKRIEKVVKSGGSPEAAAISKDGKKLYVSGRGDGVINIYNADTLEEEGEIEIAKGARPVKIVFGPDGKLYSAMSGTNKIVVFKSDKETAQISVGRNPVGMAFKENLLYVTHMNEDFIVVIDTDNYSVRDKIKIGEQMIRDIEFR